MVVEYVRTVIVGAGQQGCGVAAALQDVDQDSVVVEQGEIGQAWLHERWDSLRVASGNRSVRFPGWEYPGDDLDGCMSGPELAGHLREYVSARKLRVREHTTVEEIECPQGDDVRFRTRLSTGDVLESRNLVAAVGGYARPRTPALASDVDTSVHQLHSCRYRNPRSLPDGAVLVVGAGISGQQIADELVGSDRAVFLSVGRHRAWPSRYRGRAITEWIHTLSLYEDFVSTPAAPANGQPLLPGLPVTATQDKREDLNLGTLAAKGVVLVGSSRAARGSVLALEDNVVAVAEAAGRSYRQVLGKIDTGIRQRGFAAPEQKPAPGVDMTHIRPFGTELDLAGHGITTIIWCTGFGPDYRILPARVLDDRGAPIQEKGIFGVLPGLYYAGLPDGDSQATVGIGANVENGRVIARHVYADHVLHSASPASLVAP